MKLIGAEKVFRQKLLEEMEEGIERERRKRVSHINAITDINVHVIRTSYIHGY